MSYGDSLQVVNQKNRQLRSLLATMPWPRLASFEVAGKHYTLPLKTGKERPDTDVRSLTGHDENPEYLAGFFDGDGCVRCASNLSGVELCVAQAVDGAEVLLQFARTFGGSIHRHKDGLGLHKPCLVWRISGCDARHTARCLAPCSITKRRQLEVASTWPADSARRESCKKELSSLKRHDSGIAGHASWRYFAGFFDADGYILQRQGRNCLQLSIRQKYAAVLQCLQGFLGCEIGWLRHSVKLSKLSNAFELRICTTSACKHILEEMLLSGLVRKAAQAELALTLNDRNAAQVRSAMMEMVGNQMFGKRLDDYGLERAKKISVARNRASRFRQRGLLQAADALLREVEVLKSEHALLNVQLENRQLHEYIRSIESMTPNVQRCLRRVEALSILTE